MPRVCPLLFGASSSSLTACSVDVADAVATTTKVLQFLRFARPTEVTGLRQRALRALSWSFAESIGLQVVRFGIGIVLARTLTPAEFGLIAMVMVFITVSQTLLDGGFASALIQKQDVTPLDKSSVFYFNILMGVLYSIVLWSIAPWVASFYGQPILRELLRALTLALILTSLGLVHSTLIIRSIDFKTEFRVSLIAATLSGIIGITMALRDFGVWSLAIQQITHALFRMLTLWFVCDWRPSLTFSFAALRGMFGFGSRLAVSNVLNQVFENLYYIVIGRLFSAGDLGLFTRAKTLQDLPSGVLSNMVSRVTLPLFASIQDDQKRVRKGLKQALTMTMMANTPVMIGMAVVGDPLIRVLFGPSWLPAVPYFQLLCVTGLLLPLHVMNLNVLTALGRSDLFLRLEFIKKGLIVVSIVLTWQLGIIGLIWGLIVVSVVAYGINSYYSGKLVGYPLFSQIKDVFPFIGVGLWMALFVYWVGLLLPEAPLLTLIVQATLGAAVYFLLCRAFRLEAFVESFQECRRALVSLTSTT